MVISGSDFGATVSVSFGGAPGSVSSSTSDTINVVTPAHAAGLVDVVVTNPDGQFSTLVNGFTYEPLSVTSVSPVSGPTAGSTSVTITGSYFVSGAGVTFGGAAAGSVTFVSSTQLTAVTPAHAAGLVDVVVTNPDGQSGTLVNGFTYVAPPSIASVTPNSGSTVGGTAVVISGSDFGATPSVTFGGAAASVSSSTSDTINVVTPAHAAGAVNVVVTNPDGQFSTLVNGFTYFPPSITSVSPVSGPTAGGTVVTITGSYFVSGAGVTFGGAAAGSVTFVSSTQLTAVTPAHAAGLVDVVVTNPDGQSGTLVNGFTYVAPPTVSSFNPRIGPYTGDTSVTVTGSNFVSGAIVTFGGVAGSVTFVSSTELTAVTPASAVGYVTVRVINPDGQSANAPYQFLYRISPVPIGTVFVTPAPSSGNLRGLTGADNRCQFYANGGGFGGTWKAWLSTSTVNANTRITDATYRRLDNVIVANSMADLTDGSIANRINVSSDGSMLGFQYVWTGTTAAGVYPGGSSTTYSCSDWASSSSSHSGIGGFTSYTTSSWTYGSRLTCNSLERLYCFKTS
ncbi:IPT/TIG domain-containing protein [Candidatus Woesearchaeota archaeon]|nr:IPT/TIG domain-containing protein [Candidatus Woesearchaeota archaeon]